MSAKIRFVIIANPRTGTNNFIDLLNSHPEVTCHREVFHPDAVYLKEGTRLDLLEKRNRDPLDFLHELYDASPTRACGFKIFMNHNDDVLDAVLHDREIKKIVLYRANVLAVYASDIIAAAEKRYLIVEDVRDRIDSGANDRPRTKAKATFDPSQFEAYMSAYQTHYKHATDILNATNQQYLLLSYQSYVNENLFRRLFPFLGLSQPEVVQTRMKKMNSGDILSRFVNPEDARAYLLESGKPHWAYEGFMLWTQREDIKKIASERAEARAAIEKTEQRQPLLFGKLKDNQSDQVRPIDEYEKELTECLRQLADKTQVLAERERQLAACEQRVGQLLTSLSWRITRPLRKVYEVLGGGPSSEQ